MMTLDHYDKAIIHYVGNTGERNTNEIADELGISWATARKHILRLYKLKYLTKKKRNGAITWTINWEK